MDLEFAAACMMLVSLLSAAIGYWIGRHAGVQAAVICLHRMCYPQAKKALLNAWRSGHV